MNKSEVWKTYPEFDFIQGSNLGRVRTVDRVVKTKNGMRLIKGRILKRQLDRYGYLFVGFSVNGKKVNRKVHRIIDQTFLPNPNELPQVNHKNCDRTENCVDNLEWCTPEYNMQYKEKYGTSAAEALGCPVYAVNLETIEVSKFPSQLGASRALGIVDQNISAVIKGKLKTAGGYWFTKADENAVESAKAKFGDGVARKVEQLMSKKEL